MGKRYSIQELTSLIGVSRPTLKKMMDNREIGYLEIAGRKFCTEDQLSEYLKSVEVPATAANSETIQ